MPDFETSSFVQLVFALAIPDLFCYSIPFASVFMHTVKVIEEYCEEISHCISHVDFNYSSIVRKNIPDSQLIMKLNQALNDVTIEYGDLQYRFERILNIYERNVCEKMYLVFYIAFGQHWFMYPLP
jgi:hypothetical protein